MRSVSFLLLSALALAVAPTLISAATISIPGYGPVTVPDSIVSSIPGYNSATNAIDSSSLSTAITYLEQLGYLSGSSSSGGFEAGASVDAGSSTAVGGSGVTPIVGSSSGAVGSNSGSAVISSSGALVGSSGSGIASTNSSVIPTGSASSSTGSGSVGNSTGGSGATPNAAGATNAVSWAVCGAAVVASAVVVAML